MFELVVHKLPELRELEDKIQALEAELVRSQGRVQGLADRVAEVREADLNNAAAALNAGRKPPPPKEPSAREQLEEATRELEILERRLSLATADRARFVGENHERLARLLEEARASEGLEVAARASEALESLLRYFAAEDAVRAMARLHPPAEPENSGPAQPSVTVWGNINTRNVTGGLPRGSLEGALRHLMSLGPPTEVGPAEGEAGAA